MESPEEETVRKSYFAKAHEVIQKHNNDPEATHRWGQLAHNHFSAMVFIFTELSDSHYSNFNF